MHKHAHIAPIDLAAALAVVLIWGFNFVAMKYALRAFTPFQLGFWRYVFAVLPLLLFVRRPTLSWRWLVPAGLAQLGQFGFLFVALQAGMTSALASVLMQTQVFLTTLLGLVFLHERLSGPMVGGLVLASLGLGCFAMNAVEGSGSGATVLGLLLNLVAAAMWAVSNIVTRRAQMAEPGFDPLQFVVWMSLVPIGPFALLAVVAEPAATRWQWTQAPVGAWVSVAYLGWLATVTAYALWTRLLKRHPASRIAPFSLGVPVIGMAAGTLLLGETVTRWQWGGAACVVLALAVVMVLPGLRHTLRGRPAVAPAP